MTKTEIDDGMIVRWHPANIGRIVGDSEKNIRRFMKRIGGALPVVGMIRDIRGEFGILSFLRSGGTRDWEFARLDELELVRRGS